MTNPIQVPAWPLVTGENGLCRLDMIVSSAGALSFVCDWCNVSVQGTSTNFVYRVLLTPLFPINNSDLTYAGTVAPNALISDFIGTGMNKTFTIHAGPMMSTFDNGTGYFEVICSSPTVVTDTTYGTCLAFYVKFLGEPAAMTPITATYYAAISITSSTRIVSNIPKDSTVWTIPNNRFSISSYPLKQSYMYGVGNAMLTSGWSTNKGLKGQVQFLNIQNTATGKYSVKLQNIFDAPTGNLISGGVKDFNYSSLISVTAQVNLNPALTSSEWSPTQYFCNYYVDTANSQIVVYTFNSSGTLTTIGVNDKLVVTGYFNFKIQGVT